MAKKYGISIVSMSRGRPAFLRQMWESALSMADEPEEIELCVYVDHDDSVLNKYRKFAQESGRVRLVEGFRPTDVGKGFNSAFIKASADIIFCNTDDCFIRTKSWDSLVFNWFDGIKDKIYLVHGNDGIHGGNKATHFFLHRNWIQTLGYVVPPYFICERGDRWLTEIADRVNRRGYLLDLSIEHMHYSKKTAPLDATTTERTAMRKSLFTRDKWLKYYDQLQSKRDEDVAKLQSFINNFEE